MNQVLTAEHLLGEAMAGLHGEATVPKGTALKCGVDLGTASIILALLDQDDAVVATAMEPCQVAKDGLVVDYMGAIDITRRLKRQLEERTGRELEAAAIAVPPGTGTANSNTHRHVVEGAGLEVTAVLDEPTAANLVLGITDGAVVDIGGGTTGLSVFKDGQVVYVADEPTGGTHMSLVLMGRYGLTFEQAEAMKQDPAQADEVRAAVLPVSEKMATIVEHHLAGQAVDEVWLVGGAAGLKGIEDVFAGQLGRPTHKPPHPMMVTPLGIAMSCEARQG
ncbi:MAG: ethanolamine utilization protein EutJ [Bifidobacteriaceae bacterium]|jgi:ethanolamine utilization protein EutJ|nr:ethanolamine utilization protein EutJ [Bifidobacteriaceae bacterium]